MTASVNSVVRRVAAEIGGGDARVERFERRFVDRARGVGGAAVVDVRKQRGRGEDHRERVGDVLAQIAAAPCRAALRPSRRSA